MIKNITCGCGGEKGIHEVGKGNCFRELVLKSEEPKKFGVEKKLWKLPKQKAITDFTLREQRGYCFHKEYNIWSKPKKRANDWFESKGWD